MNKITSIIVVLLIVGCDSFTNNSTESNSTGKQGLINHIRVDSVIVEEKELKDSCFVIERSTFPKITGIIDKDFENKLNDIFKNNFYSYIKNAKKEYGGCLEIEFPDEYLVNLPATAVSSFKVLTKNDSIISVVQYMISGVGHGGNAWEPSSTGLTADFKNKIIYGKKEFKIDRDKIEYLNIKIRDFFDNLFPGSNEGIYPFIQTNDDFNKLVFGLRNDSLMLIIQAYPAEHYTYSTYIVPIDQMNNIK